MRFAFDPVDRIKRKTHQAPQKGVLEADVIFQPIARRRYGVAMSFAPAVCAPKPSCRPK